MNKKNEKAWSDIELNAVHLKSAVTGLSLYMEYCLEETKGREGALGLLSILEGYTKNFCNDIIDKNFKLD